MIRLCTPEDFESIWTIINDGARAYQGVIPPDRLAEPYMSRGHLQHEIAEGVTFHGYSTASHLTGVMGLQQVQDVTLIRHAYVLTAAQSQGIGAKLLAHLRTLSDRPILIGTWADATWAIAFYRKHGFQPVTFEEKTRLLKRYWTVPDRQIETSIVLADDRFRAQRSNAPLLASMYPK